MNLFKTGGGTPPSVDLHNAPKTFSGIKYLHTVENTKLKIFSVGEIHAIYDINQIDAFHNYLNTNKLQGPNSYVIVEDTYLWEESCSKSVIPRFFDKTRIVSADDVRESFMPIVGPWDPDTNKEIESYIANFVQNNTIRPIPAMNVPFVADPKKITDLPQIPDAFSKFITISKDTDNVYNLLKHRVDPSHDYNTLLDISDNPIKVLASPNKQIRHDVVQYVLSMYDFVYKNFVYRVVKWLQTKNVEVQWSQITDIITQAAALVDAVPENKLISQNNGYLVSNQCITLMTDFIAVQKILDLYDQSPLIWICAGYSHNISILHIIKNIYELLGDPVTETQVILTDNNINTYADYGLNVDLFDKAINMKNEDAIYHTISDFLINTKKINAEMVIIVINAIKGANISLHALRLVAMCILNQQVLKKYTSEQVDNIFGDKLPIIKQQSDYYWYFIDDIRYLFTPKWELQTILEIPTYDIIDLISDNKSASFKDFKDGTNVLEVPTSIQKYEHSSIKAMGLQVYQKRLIDKKYSSTSDEVMYGYPIYADQNLYYNVKATDPALNLKKALVQLLLEYNANMKTLVSELTAIKEEGQTTYNHKQELEEAIYALEQEGKDATQLKAKVLDLENKLATLHNKMTPINAEYTAAYGKYTQKRDDILKEITLASSPVTGGAIDMCDMCDLLIYIIVAIIIVLIVFYFISQVVKKMNSRQYVYNYVY